MSQGHKLTKRIMKAHTFTEDKAKEIARISCSRKAFECFDGWVVMVGDKYIAR